MNLFRKNFLTSVEKNECIFDRFKGGGWEKKNLFGKILLTPIEIKNECIIDRFNGDGQIFT